MCPAPSMDLPDPFSPASSIIHRFQEVLQATSCIGTELLYIYLPTPQLGQDMAQGKFLSGV